MNGVWGKVNLGKKEADVLSKQSVSEDSFARALQQSSYTLTGYLVTRNPDAV